MTHPEILVRVKCLRCGEAAIVPLRQGEATRADLTASETWKATHWREAHGGKGNYYYETTQCAPR